jgi:hypothetical protein
MKTFYPGTKVIVYDPYYSYAGEWRIATVLKWYGFKCEYIKKWFGEEASHYESCIDVEFEDGTTSDGHFTENLKILD